MVVVCESCSTRFRVDGARIPPKGTLVRCSRCKATFIAKAPEASFEETVQDVVAEVAEAGGEPTPSPSEDLFEEAPDDLGATLREQDEDAWEFDEEPAERPPEPAMAAPEPRLPTPEPEAPEPEPRAIAPERATFEATNPALDELGPPDDWDLLGDSVDSTARGATFVEEREAGSAAPAELEFEPEPAEAAREEATAEPPVPAAERLGVLGRGLAAAGRRVLQVGAWTGVAAALVVGGFGVMPRAPQALPLASTHELLPLPDGEAREVQVRFVENAFAGTLYVVQGDLVRLAEEPTLGLRVRWRDASGAPIGPGEWAQPLPAERALRERAPEAWHHSHAGLEAAPARGTFAAIFTELPAEAAGVALSLEPLPASALASPEGGVTAPEGEVTAPEGDATSGAPAAAEPKPGDG